jgi:YbbR domain-containing protein
VEQAVRLEPRDQRGFLVQGVTVEPSVMGVTISIEPIQFSRTVVIVPDVRGTPLAGHDLVAVTVRPSTVTLLGPRVLIQDTEVVQTEPVDIANASSTIVRAVSLELPSGASVSSEVTVIVTVEVEAASGQRLFLVSVVATGLAEGPSIVGELPAVEVTLSGPLPTLSEVSSEEITASLDLSALEAGSHTVEVTVTPPTGLQVESVSPDEIEVLLGDPGAPQGP